MTNKNNHERELMVSHQSDLLTQDLILSGIKKHCKFTDYGLSFDFPLIKYEHGSGDISYPIWQVKELKKLELSEKQLPKLINFLKKELSDYKKYLDKFEKNIKSSTNKGKRIHEYFEKSMRGVSTIPYFAFEMALYKKLEQENVTPQDIPSSLTDTSLASLELEKIAKKFKKELHNEKISSNLKKELKNFCDRFAYLGMIYFKGHPWAIPEAYRMLLTAETGYTPDEKKISSKYLDFASQLLKLRTRKWEIMCYGTSLFRKFILMHFPDEIIYDNLLNLRISEVLDLVDGKYSKIDKAKGREYFDLEITENDVVLTIRNKKETKTEQLDIKEIKGATAQPVKVIGIIKVVMGHTQGYKVEPGDILVTKMSTPDFLPAMKKAAAFVTDIGGITSHAAIVSREMGKPCIIGTKIATKVLRDGMLVEVDAEKGIVKVLEKAN